ncbi:MAG: hypothetical protein ACI9HK_003305 [Pirellulaceae bacterium]|jgi:hypothetical protein
MGHTVLACVELLGYMFSWCIIIGLFAGVDNLDAMVFTALFAIVILGIEHGIDAALTYFIAKKGLKPRGRVD